MHQKAIIMDENTMERAITRISYEILERNKGAKDICVIGIMSRGVFLAKRIAEKINQLEGALLEVGTLDITSYRDDEKHIADTDITDIPFDLSGRGVILVDDVIFTGRSTRAAIDAIIKRGRPESIQLAVLIDRGHRELPIRPDYIGKNLPTSKNEAVKVLMKEIDNCDKVLILENE